LHLFSSCLINCELKTSISVKLSIQSQCNGPQCSKKSSYQWILYQQCLSSTNDTVRGKVQLLKLFTTTSLNSSSIVIKEDSLEGGENYRLVVYPQTTDGSSGMSAQDISTASPPTRGTCSITPSRRIALKTDFKVIPLKLFYYQTLFETRRN